MEFTVVSNFLRKIKTNIALVNKGDEKITEKFDLEFDLKNKEHKIKPKHVTISSFQHWKLHIHTHIHKDKVQITYIFSPAPFECRLAIAGLLAHYRI